MDWLTWVLVAVVIVYSAALTIKTGLPLIRFRKAKDRVVGVTGSVVSFYGEEVIKKGKAKVTTHYPVYQCEINGEQKTLFGLVRKLGNGQSEVGNIAILLYDRETGELWCEKDLPLMLEQTKTRIMIMVAILIVAILASVIL